MPALAISQPLISAARPTPTRLRRAPAICAPVADAPATLRTRSSAPRGDRRRQPRSRRHRLHRSEVFPWPVGHVAHQPLYPTAGLRLQTCASGAFQPRRPPMFTAPTTTRDNPRIGRSQDKYSLLKRDPARDRRDTRCRTRHLYTSGVRLGQKLAYQRKLTKVGRNSVTRITYILSESTTGLPLSLTGNSVPRDALRAAPPPKGTTSCFLKFSTGWLSARTSELRKSARRPPTHSSNCRLCSSDLPAT